MLKFPTVWLRVGGRYSEVSASRTPYFWSNKVFKKSCEFDQKFKTRTVYEDLRPDLGDMNSSGYEEPEDFIFWLFPTGNTIF